MKVKLIKSFIDKDTKKLYEYGKYNAVFDVSKEKYERIKDYVVIVEENNKNDKNNK